MGSSGQTVFNNDNSSSSFLTATGSSAVSNKTLDNTNTLTIKDANLTIQDDGDVTKQAKFQASGITAGQTRTYTLPDASVTLNLGTNINSGAATSGQLLTADGSAGSSWTTFGPTSEIWRDTGNGRGGSVSGETTVVNTSTSQLSNGSDITFTARTTTNGDKYTINTAGTYNVMCTYESASSGAVVAITKNSSGLSTAPQSLAASQVLSISQLAAGNVSVCISVTTRLAVNDVIRIQSDANPAAVDRNKFHIMRVN